MISIRYNYSPNDHETSRILNPQLIAPYPLQGGRPKTWHPSSSQVRKPDLSLVDGIGLKSRAIIVEWLTGKRATDVWA
ncbi:hypothetical protein GCM10007874_11340 [Labrys miyagiensis]|uniref:Uncharacterized protein n=1 Tax=Labrys miyagiensis TaxID=346912 RepID=A0ABQ6CCV5_9HYPH|nr:hypothetical protein GCM10007874_11340 [Labrys miyagiensis]